MKNFKKSLILLMLIILIGILYHLYYSFIGNFLGNNCKPIIGGYIGNDVIFIDFLTQYKIGDRYICLGYDNSLFKNTQLTISIYFGFIWLLIIPIIIHIFNLQKSKYYLLYCFGIIILAFYIFWISYNISYMEEYF